jgi:D-amino-acid dehydrogenase
LAEKYAIIIGAGLAGVTAAWMLHHRGWRVTVLDASEGPAMGASFANAGALTPSEPEPWNSPGVHWQLLASLCDPHAAMKLRLSAVPGLTSWGLRFLRNSTRTRHRAATQANYALSRHSLSLTQALRDELGLEFDNNCHGTMKLCRDQDALRATINAAEQLASDGLNFEPLCVDETIRHEPQLEAIADKIAGSILFRDDESGDAYEFTKGLMSACMAAGIDFEWNSQVTSLIDRGGRITGVRTQTEVIEVDAVVVACGHASWRLLKPLGLHLPVRPVKGYSLTYDATGLDEMPGLPVVDEQLHAIVTPMGNRLRVAGTAEICGEDLSLPSERVENLQHLLRSLYPRIADRLDGSNPAAWAGLRPMSADGKPMIGETRAPGLWLSTGHGHLGWTQSVGSADLLAALMSGETAPITSHAYAASRF